MRNRVWLYRIAVIWAIFFTLSTLGTSIVAVLQNVKWSEMSAQSKFITCILIFMNWASAMMAFLSTTIHRIERGRLPINGRSGDTEHLTKEQAATTKTQ